MREEVKSVFKINSEKDLVVAPVSYFKGMEDMLQKFVNAIEIHDLDVMEQLLHLRDWMNAAKVDEEVRKMYPNLQWDNIHLLLPQEESCCNQCNCQKDNEHFQQ